MRLHDIKRLVVKVGSSTLTHENGKPNFRRIEQLARVLADLKNSGIEIVLVSSGAIAVGTERLKLTEHPRTTREKQAAAAVGQCELIFAYDKIFSEYGQIVAQILLTRDIVEDRQRKENSVGTLSCLLEMGVIPIINENDTVATEEIDFGDNDRLSAIVAMLCNADALIILSDIDGLYDSDPRENPNARLIPDVYAITPEITAAAGGTGTARGTGGMHSKLEAAQMAMGAGINTVIMNGDCPSKLCELLEGASIGTVFHAAARA